MGFFSCDNVIVLLFFIFCRKKITDVTDEENNFLMVFSGFKKVVYPVIKREYITKCNDEMLYKIRMELYDQQTNRNEKPSRKKGIYLTQNQQHQLFSPKG